MEDIVLICKIWVESSIRNAVQEKEEGEGHQEVEKTAPKTSTGFLSGEYNMGGPERMSRVDMAMAVATVREYDPKGIVSAPSSTISRGVASPPDISMNSVLLEERVGFKFTKFHDALVKIFNL